MGQIDWAMIDGAALLKAVAPTVTGVKVARQARIIADFGSQLPILCGEHHVDTPLRVAHFLAQMCHESDGFAADEEYASGAAYEGRADLGNTFPGDGERFKGRALPMITGRANHRDFTTWARSFYPDAPDFEANPKLLAVHPWRGLAAFWFWATRNLNKLADEDDLVAITRRINGGLNGLSSRRTYLYRAKAAIAALAAASVTAPPGRPVLHRGMTGEAVAELQRAINKVSSTRIAVDGDFGPATEAVVRSAQEFYGLVADGIVGVRTWAALGITQGA